MKARLILGLVAWAALATAAISVAGDPGMAAPVWLF